MHTTGGFMDLLSAFPTPSVTLAISCIYWQLVFCVCCMPVVGVTFWSPLVAGLAPRMKQVRALLSVI